MGIDTHLKMTPEKVRMRSLIPPVHRPSQLKIGTRLALCFALIVLLMMAADIVALWQFNQIRIQGQLLNQVDQKSVSVLRLHASILSLQDHLEDIASSQDTAFFITESEKLRQELLTATDRCRQTLIVKIPGMQPDPLVLSTLQAIQSALPGQIDTLNSLAVQGDWQAVHLRLENQTKMIRLLSSSLVEKVDLEVAAGRSEALDKIQQGQQRVLLVFSATVFLTLLTAMILGLIVTRSITRPLAHLDAGAQAWARGDFQYQVNADGKDELAVLGQLFNDASQRLHQLYKTLKSNEARFRSLIEHSSDVILLLDREGIIHYVSPSSERILGFRPEDLQDRKLFEFIHPEDQLIVQDALSIQVAGVIRTAEIRLMRTGESIRLLEITVRNLLTDPAVSAIVMNARDITERKYAEEAMIRSEEKYRTFFERNLAGSYIATADGTILECNPALVRMFGFASAEEVKQTDFATLFSSPAKRERFLQQLKKKRRLELYEEEYRRKDGTPLPVTANAIGIFNNQDQLIEISGFLIDETERRRTEKYLLQAQKMEAIGRLAGGIAHDFNNLLGVILGCSSLILESREGPNPFRQEVQEILDASRHAASLTRQLLAFSRKQVLQPAILNLNQIIEDVEAMVRRLIGEDIEIRTVLASDLAPVKADPSQIEQVLLNLCVNARDAMPNGGAITIETANVEADTVFAAQHIPMKPGRYARLSVSDTGMGMDKEILAHIFEPFFTTKGPEKGTGLGLSTVYGIVKQSGGYISAYSELNRGTTLFIYLPVTAGDTEQNVREAKSIDSMHGTETILLVEDAAALRTLTQKILESCGYTVLEAENGEQAIKVVEKYPGSIDLLLTDVIMPHMSGPALAEYLLTVRPGIKVLFMSGYTDDAIADNGLLRTGTTLLEKPFTMQALAGKIREVLENTDSA